VSPLAHEDIQELLGAYALHAVDPDEAALVEAHLQECPRCRAEVEGHREVATMLGNTGGDAPPGVWDRIASQLEDTPPPMRLEVQEGAPVTPIAPRRRDGASRFAAVALGAAAALVIAVLGVQVVRQQDQLDDMEAVLEAGSTEAAANLAFGDPDATKVQLQSTDGTTIARAVVLPDGSAYLMGHELPGLDDDRTYQLWGDTGDGTLVSLGLLGADPTTVTFRAGGDLAALAITEEEAGGVVQSRNPAVVAGPVD
jgi:anti-sigma-K factor RskA